jgi:hypothetical protein
MVDDNEVKKPAEPSNETNDPSELSDKVLDTAAGGGGVTVGDITITKNHDASS